MCAFNIGGFLPPFLQATTEMIGLCYVLCVLKIKKHGSLEVLSMILGFTIPFFIQSNSVCYRLIPQMYIKYLLWGGIRKTKFSSKEFII